MKHVFIPALVSERFMRYEMPPGMNGMRANGLYSSSVELSSLNGNTSNIFSGMVSSSLLCLLVCVRLCVPFSWAEMRVGVCIWQQWQ